MAWHYSCSHRMRLLCLLRMAKFQDSCIKSSQHVAIPTRSNSILFSNKLSGKSYGKNCYPKESFGTSHNNYTLIKMEANYAYTSEVLCIVRVISAECSLVAC